ncbi:hypothetical protein V8F06_011862 [Rhypophila decipiens]
MMLPSISTTSILLLLPFFSQLVVTSSPTAADSHIHPLENVPTPSPPRANISSYTSHGTGCPNGAGAVIGPTSQSDKLQTLTFYSQDFTLYGPNSAAVTILDTSKKSCNGTISLTYPDGYSFKLEAVTYSVMSRLEREVNAYFMSVYSLSPGAGAGSGVAITDGEDARISHKWQFNGTGRAQRTFRRYTLLDMIRSTSGLAAGPGEEEAPVLSSVCGHEQDGGNALDLKIDSRVEVRNTSSVALGRIDDDPDFELEMVQLHLRWEACQ